VDFRFFDFAAFVTFGLFFSGLAMFSARPLVQPQTVLEPLSR
jgi:hypothetical protein